ncbi:MAG: transcription antitermination factor NusB [Gammaproteobacteria bacterium]|nr:transcription antitermination factor NusB [Gammaproteobacteria bacterium]
MKFNVKARRKAREFVVQALYQWQMTGLAESEVLLQFLTFDGIKQADQAYFKHLFLGVTEHVLDLDEKLLPFLDRPLKDVSPIEMAILRLGGFELLHCPELPYRVALNESIELSKIYGGTDSHKFTNGVLDKLAKQLRSIEMAAENKE